MSTAEQRQEWARLAEAATPGEWEIRNHGSAGSAIVTGEYERVFTVARTFEHENAAFIAASRTAVPALLADVDRLTAERDAAYRLLEGLTPGGSEFYDSPQNCAEWAMDRMRNVMEQVKARKAAETERDELAGQLAKVRDDIARAHALLADVPDYVDYCYAVLESDELPLTLESWSKAYAEA
jgi:hypothetical protein